MEPVTTLISFAWPWISQPVIDTLSAWFGDRLQRQVRQLEVKLRLAPILEPKSREFAWEVYVELVTRISIVPLPDDEGSDREALASLYSLFGNLREALVRAGPDTAKPSGDGTSVATFVAVLLNTMLRPFLSHWHPHLEQHEVKKGSRVSRREHEAAWADHLEFRRELRELQENLVRFAAALEELLELPKMASLRELSAPPSL